MTKKEFREFCVNKTVCLDGATGSNLIRRGMPVGVCPEKWISQNREVMLALQKEYVEAGSQILYAPTFTANRIKLAEYGLEKEQKELIEALVGISKEAAGGRALVAGDITMTGRQLQPVGDLDFEELIDVYKEQIVYLERSGADLLVVETMMSLQECRAALIAAKEAAPALPVMVSMTFEADGRTLFGNDPLTSAIVLESLGADAVGANCSAGPDRLAEVVRIMAGAVRVPVIAKPNAGLPSLDAQGMTVYDMDPEQFAEEMRACLDAGARVLGGCCGTTPAHIESLCRLVSSLREALPPVASAYPEGTRFLTSERRTLSFGLDDPFMVVGERINPTGKKKLQAELREGSFERVTAFAEEQEEAGACVLDVNMGMSGIDEKTVMLQALEEISGVTSLPLSIDSSHVEVIEAALRRYPGRALINSISLEQEKIEKLLPLAQKYGAMFILLPLSDKGLPESLDEKKEIIGRILERAYAQGLRREDVIVDGLVTTVGANPAAARETLETIRYCKEKGLATTCGLSNISFGLPERDTVNTAFLTMAIQAGLTMAIANPSQELLMAGMYAADLLMHKEESDSRYISFMDGFRERLRRKQEAAAAVSNAGAAGRAGNAMAAAQSGGAGPAKSTASAAAVPSGTSASKNSGGASGAAVSAAEPEALTEEAEKVYEAVMKGNRKGIVPLTKAAVEKGIPAKALLDHSLLPAINEVGELFDKGKYFLPQLISSAEAMKLSIGYLEPMLATGSDKEKMPVVVIATVQGDIHDIGKNLAGLMLKNYGFEVIDLGKDVPKEKIIEAAKEHHAGLIGLSALMTTTMQEMKHVIEYARQEGVDAKIIIGGAVITQEYADEIHADGYAGDAAECVRVAKRLLGLNDHENKENRRDLA